MSKLSLAVLLVLALAGFASASHASTCGHNGERLSIKDRNVQERILIDVQRMANLTLRSDEVYRIPIVWHVLTDRASNRVSRERILRDMENLNLWFAANNQYYTTDDMFSSVVARPNHLKIEFYLAEKDPEGNNFDGVRYINSPLAENGCSFGQTDSNYDSRGGADMWPHTEYLNIYTCGISDGFAGFAYGPGTNSEYDCIVLDWKHVGNDEGSLIAHEAGHWLGLPHTFDGNSCSGDDGFSDTPNTNGAALYWLPSDDYCNANNVNGPPFQRCNGETAMVRNVMDYNYNECKGYFTQQQAARMRGHLSSPSSPRSKLPYSYALPPACSSYDCAGKTCGPDGCGGVCGICGSYDLCTEQNCVSTIPPNINCRFAEVLPQYTDGVTVVKNNGGVDTGYLVGSCGGPTHNDASLWYKFTAKANGNAAVNTAGSSVSAYVDVLTTDASCSTYSCAFGGGSSSISGSVVAGRTYYIIVSSYNLAPADLSVTLTMTGSGYTPSGPPPSTPTSSPTPPPATSSTAAPSASSTSAASQSGTASRSAAPSPSTAPSPSGAPSQSPSQSNIPAESSSPSPPPPAESSAASTSRSPAPSLSSAESQSPAAAPSSTTSVSPAAPPSTPASQSSTPSPSSPPSVSPAPSPVCDAAVECPANGYECGTAFICSTGIEVNCGTCANTFVCNSANQCTCPQGMTLEGTQCVTNVPTGVPDFSDDFVQVLPASPNGVEFSATSMRGLNSNQNLLVWTASSGLVDPFNTIQSLIIKATSGTVAVGLKYGQGALREHDRVEWRFTNLDGARTTLMFCPVWYNDENQYCSNFGSYDFPTGSVDGLKITVTLSQNSGNVVTELHYEFTDSQGGSFNYNFNGQTSGYPLDGALTYRVSSNAAEIRDLKMATSSALRITLGTCMDDEKFLELFYALSGADPRTSKIVLTARDVNGDCGKGASHGKALVSGFTMVVSSVGVPAAQLSQTFLAAANAPGFVTVASATAIIGTAGATAAGIPTTAAGATAATVAIPGAAAGGGGGGAGGGLSGGAIAGIVIGSVGGAILLVGVSALVVAAVVVAAVVITRKDGEGPSAAPDSSRRRSVRQTLHGFFGRVDVMNNPGKGHQSISGRAPAMA